jgi:hypothetical protein
MNYLSIPLMLQLLIILKYVISRGENQVPVPSFWPKPGTGTEFPVIGFSITRTGSGLPG